MTNSGLQLLEIEVTTNCNLHCNHCYVTGTGKDMPKAMALDVVDQASKLNPHDLLLTGGEPLLYSHLFELAEYARNRLGSRLGLLTNGLLINKELANKLESFDFLQLSLDNVPGTIGHVRDNYSRQIANSAVLLKKRGIRVTLQCTLHKDNVAYIGDIVGFARNLGVQIGFNRMCPVGHATNIISKCLTKRDLRRAFTRVYKAASQYEKIRCSDPLINLISKERRAYVQQRKILGGCTAGVAGCYVAVNGDVYACALLRKRVDNVKNLPLIDIWFKNRYFNLLRDRNNLKGSCGDCRHKLYCGGCRATAYSLKHDFLDSDPFCWRSSNCT